MLQNYFLSICMLSQVAVDFQTISIYQIIIIIIIKLNTRLLEHEHPGRHNFVLKIELKSVFLESKDAKTCAKKYHVLTDFTKMGLKK